MTTHDPVTAPAHYQGHPSGIQCWEVVNHLPAELANLIKYCWRWQDKNGTEDLKKALWYLDRINYVTWGIIQSHPIYQANSNHIGQVLEHEPENSPLAEALTFFTFLRITPIPDEDSNLLDLMTNPTRRAIIQTTQEQEAH